MFSLPEAIDLDLSQLLIIITARPHCLIALRVTGNKESYCVDLILRLTMWTELLEQFH